MRLSTLSVADCFSGWDGVRIDRDVLTQKTVIHLTVGDDRFADAMSDARCALPRANMRELAARAERAERFRLLGALSRYGRKRR